MLKSQLNPPDTVWLLTVWQTSGENYNVTYVWL